LGSPWKTLYHIEGPDSLPHRHHPPPSQALLAFWAIPPSVNLSSLEAAVASRLQTIQSKSAEGLRMALATKATMDLKACRGWIFLLKTKKRGQIIGPRIFMFSGTRRMLLQF